MKNIGKVVEIEVDVTRRQISSGFFIQRFIISTLIPSSIYNTWYNVHCIGAKYWTTIRSYPQTVLARNKLMSQRHDCDTYVQIWTHFRWHFRVSIVILLYDYLVTFPRTCMFRVRSRPPNKACPIPPTTILQTASIATRLLTSEAFRANRPWIAMKIVTATEVAPASSRLTSDPTACSWSWLPPSSGCRCRSTYCPPRTSDSVSVNFCSIWRWDLSARPALRLDRRGLGWQVADHRLSASVGTLPAWLDQVADIPSLDRGEDGTPSSMWPWRWSSWAGSPVRTTSVTRRWPWSNSAPSYSSTRCPGIRRRRLSRTFRCRSAWPTSSWTSAETVWARPLDYSARTRPLSEQSSSGTSASLAVVVAVVAVVVAVAAACKTAKVFPWVAYPEAVGHFHRLSRVPSARRADEAGSEEQRRPDAETCSLSRAPVSASPRATDATGAQGLPD